VTLLRALNVGGGTTVRMRDIVDVYRPIGLTEVSTYGQAGSVVFTAPRTVSQMCHEFAEPGGHRRIQKDMTAVEIEYRRTRKETAGHGRT
jgi:hypothetical protein